MNLNIELIQASKGGDLSQVKSLIIEGANVHTEEGDYALRWAAIRGHLKVVKYLVSKGANVHASNDVALRCAAGGGHFEVVKYLKSYIVSQFTNRHIDKQKRIEKSNQVFKEIRALPGIGIDYLYAFENFNHLKTIY